MSICTFFGHRDTPPTAEEPLKKAIVELIEKHGVDLFYVGNQGLFDSMVKKCLMSLKKEYPHISYYVVLAYIPVKKQYSNENFEDTICPEGIENIPRKYAVCKRNMWMIGRSRFVIVWVRHITGGASKYAQIALKKGKTVINIAETVFDRNKKTS